MKCSPEHCLATRGYHITSHSIACPSFCSGRSCVPGSELTWGVLILLWVGWSTCSLPIDSDPFRLFSGSRSCTRNECSDSCDAVMWFKQFSLGSGQQSITGNGWARVASSWPAMIYSFSPTFCWLLHSVPTDNYPISTTNERITNGTGINYNISYVSTINVQDTLTN